MPEPISFGKIEVDLASTMEETKGTPESERPFSIALLGDFSGRGNRGIFDKAALPSGRRFISADRDNIDAVLKNFSVEIKLQILGEKSEPVSIRFSKMDDFHPDRLFETLDVFQALKETRQGLKDPATFAILTKKSSILPSPLAGEGKGEGVFNTQTTGGLLDQILEETEGRKPDAKSSQRPTEWDSFLKEIVSPHLVPDIEKDQSKMIASVDAASGELMRMILHHPDFQAIEATWRAVYFLVSRLDTDSQIQLYLFDISKEELAADLSAVENLRTTAMYRLLVEQRVETYGSERWAVIAGNYTFDYTREDAELIGRMARIARHAGAPFLSAAHTHLAGCESLMQTPGPDDWKWLPDREGKEAWDLLRKLPEASSIGLGMPRFLLRLPYGADTDPTESFAFEEMPGKPTHGHYLWGNPSFVIVLLLAQSFGEYGWDFQPGVILNIEGMPLHVYKEQGESKIKPCAEILFTEQAVDVILEKGIMPLISYKNQDIIRLARLQSISDPATNLAGIWG